VCAHLGLGFARRHSLTAELEFGQGTTLLCALCAVCSMAASGEAVAVTTQRNNAATLPRPAGFSLRCQRRVRELSFRSPASVLLRPVKVRGFCLEGAEQAGGPVVAWWLAQTRPWDRVVGAWGRSQTDGLSLFASSTAVLPKAMWRWSSWRPPTTAGGGGFQRIRLAVVPWTLM